MSEGTINLADDEPSSQHEIDPHPSQAVKYEEDRLATTRLPASLPPAPASRRAAAAVVVPPPGPSVPPFGATAEPTMRYPSEPPVALPRTSWWRTLLDSTLAPPASIDVHTLRRRVGVACGVLALAFVAIGLVVGLRAVPGQAVVSPGVAIAVVVARALVALGMLGLGYALMRMGERFFAEGTRGLPEK
jgi:hypothetical protein